MDVVVTGDWLKRIVVVVVKKRESNFYFVVSSGGDGGGGGARGALTKTSLPCARSLVK